MALLSRTSYTILAVVALLTIIATSVAVWHAGRRVSFDPNPRTVETPAPPRRLNTRFSSPIEAKNTLLKMVKAVQLRRPRDIQFLISRLDDYRALPTPTDNRPKDKGKKEERKPMDPDAIGKADVQGTTRWITVSSVAQEFLSNADPESVLPVLERLKRIATEHSPERSTWTEHELDILQAGFHTLGRIQLQRQKKTKKAFEEPAIALLGSTTNEVKTRMHERTIATKQERSTRVLGMVWVTDARVTVPSYRPAEELPPQFEVEPENLQLVLECLGLALAQPPLAKSEDRDRKK